MSQVEIPGKVMLSGEYAVLYGGQAVMMPVPRFLKLRTIEYNSELKYSKVINEALNYRLPEIAKIEKESDNFSVELDYSEFFNLETKGHMVKLGLGSSAAEAVGIVKLRYERAGFDCSAAGDEILKHALAIHSQAQQGKGSGADVAACAVGQPIVFKNDSGQVSIVRKFRTEICGGIPLHLLWSGVPADTRDYVSKISKTLKNDEKARSKLDYLVKQADRLAKLWFDGSPNKLYEVLDEFDNVISSIALLSGVDYKLPIHREISNWALKNGGRAKPTGAGGGDMILLIGDLPIDEFDGEYQVFKL